MTLSEVNVFTFLVRAWNIQIPAVAFPTLTVFVATITTFLANVNFIKDLIANPNPLASDPPQTFDFVIVGAGTAGSVLANRLSENGLFSVLLLEAGGDPLVNFDDVPYFGASQGHPETDWMHNTVPQLRSGFAFPNNTLAWPCGKSLGGTSSQNYMVYMRGNPNDFNNWAHLTQDDQWTYQNLLPFFKKFENYRGSFPPDPKYHGTKGPLTITPYSYHPFLSNWLQAGQQLGFPVKDPNTVQTSSFFPVEAYTVHGMRWEQYKAYIVPALERPNLKIIRYAHVTKIDLDADNTATGVTYIRNQVKFTVLASKELILSAGVAGSPKLLMLSGIGPAEHLNSVGIRPIVDLPGVGQHLMDIPGVNVGPFILNDTVSFIPERDLTIASAVEYLKHGTGRLSAFTPIGMALVSFTDEPFWPNIRLSLHPIGISEDLVIGSTLYQNYYKGFVGRDAFSGDVGLVRPKSLGSITLQSNDPFDKPLIDPNYFAEPEDLQELVKGVKLLIRLLEGTPFFQKYNATLIPHLLPGCEEFFPRSDAYFACYIQHVTFTDHNVGSTCKMGRVDDPMSVVDSNLRVKFVKKLRIADASMMPRIPNSLLTTPVTMIGEKAADLILKTWSVD